MKPFASTSSASYLPRRAALGGIAALAATPFVPLCAQPASGPLLYASQAPTLAAAVERWARSGGTLVIDGDFTLLGPITMVAVAGLSYRLTTDGPRTIAYAGGRYHWALCLYSAGDTPFVIDGALTIDGRDLVCMPLFVRFEEVAGQHRRNFRVSGLTCRNARMIRGRSPIDGSLTNAYGASGMLFSGGFDHLVLQHVTVANVTRAAGAGAPGTKGCLGIGATANLLGTQSARHVTIEDFSVTNIDSDDPAGSPARSEMDGVLVFQSAERDGTRPIIRRGMIRNAAGRGVKVFAPGGGGVTQSLRIYRSVPGAPSIGAIDIAHQHGDGLIEDIEVTYAGAAHANKTTVIGMSSGTRRDPGFPFGLGEVRNLRINDTTGVAKRALLGVQYNVAGDPAPRRYVLSDVIDSGTVYYVVLPGALGTGAPARIELTKVETNVIKGLLASEDRASQMTVVARQVRLTRGRPVPAKVFYDDRPASAGWRLRIDADASVIGLDPAL